MTFDDKKLLAMQFIRLGLEPLQAMYHCDFTEEEIKLSEADERFISDVAFEVRMEELDLLKKLNTAMDVAVSKGNSSAVQWKLERINPKWDKSSKGNDGDKDPDSKVSIIFEIPHNGRD